LNDRSVTHCNVSDRSIQSRKKMAISINTKVPISKKIVGLLALSFVFVGSTPVEREQSLEDTKQTDRLSNLRTVSLELKGIKKTDGTLDEEESLNAYNFLSVMTKSVKFNEGPLFPFSHVGGVLFNTAKVRNLIDEMWKLDLNPTLTTSVSSGNSLKEVANEFKSQIQVPPGFLPHEITAGGTFNWDNNDNEYGEFAYARTRRVVKNFRMYDGVTSKHARNQIRSLLIDGIKDQIDSEIKTPEEAFDFVKNMGPSYIVKGNFGVGFSLDTNSKSSESFKSETAEANLGVAAATMTGSKFKKGANTYNETTFKLSVYGGDQTIFDTDKKSWQFSADDDDSKLVLVGFKLAPIYALAEWRSDAEKLLRTAYNSYVQENPLRDDYLDFDSKPILRALQGVYDKFQASYVDFKKRRSNCWSWCNDMKNGYESSDQIMTVVQKLKAIVKENTLAVARSEYNNVYRTEIKGKSNTCWGVFCKDSTHYNAHYVDAEKSLGDIYNSLA